MCGFQALLTATSHYITLFHPEGAHCQTSWIHLRYLLYLLVFFFFFFCFYGREQHLHVLILSPGDCSVFFKRALVKLCMPELPVVITFTSQLMACKFTAPAAVIFQCSCGRLVFHFSSSLQFKSPVEASL